MSPPGRPKGDTGSAQHEGSPMTTGKILAVTSGKGGVGKTFVAANLAAALSARGERVLVLDADLGLANLDVVLNLPPENHPARRLHREGDARAGDPAGTGRLLGAARRLRPSSSIRA